jgi:putative sterol carrier protein
LKKEFKMTISEIFEATPSALNSAAAAGMNKTFQWNITGDEASVWALKITDGVGELIPGGVEKPDITITVSDKDWIAITEGRLDPTSAFMAGKVKIAGDMMLAMRLQQLFPRPK